MAIAVLFCTSACKKGKTTKTDETNDSITAEVTVKYATGFAVREADGVRLVDVGENDHFALVSNDDADVPEGYTKVKVPIDRTICMTMLQLSNFTILNAHDKVTGITGTKNLFDKDILQRVEDGKIVKIGMEGNFDTELILAANPDVIFLKKNG